MQGRLTIQTYDQFVFTDFKDEWKEDKPRSAAIEAIAALSTNQKEPKRHIKIEYEKRHEEDSSRDDKKTEDVAAKKRKKDTSTAQTEGLTWQPLNWRE